MDVQHFIENYRQAFGERVELPIAFWYADTPLAETEKVNGCFFKAFSKVREGQSISLNASVVTCGGGKFYTGFIDMPEMIPNFVSLKEKYKRTPQLVLDFINDLGVSRTDKQFLNFTRIDNLETFEEVEGILFLATPDILSGLATWAYLDNNSEDGVTSTFGSGCSVAVTQTISENRKGGRRTFIGFFDPSVRPHFEANILSYSVPMSRFKEMYATMRDSCLFDTHAWGKVRERIVSNNLTGR